MFASEIGEGSYRRPPGPIRTGVFGCDRSQSQSRRQLPDYTRRLRRALGRVVEREEGGVGGEGMSEQASERELEARAAHNESFHPPVSQH